MATEDDRGARLSVYWPAGGGPAGEHEEPTTEIAVSDRYAELGAALGAALVSYARWAGLGGEDNPEVADAIDVVYLALVGDGDGFPDPAVDAECVKCGSPGATWEEGEDGPFCDVMCAERFRLGR